MGSGHRVEAGARQEASRTSGANWEGLKGMTAMHRKHMGEMPSPPGYDLLTWTNYHLRTFKKGENVWSVVCSMGVCTCLLPWLFWPSFQH